MRKILNRTEIQELVEKYPSMEDVVNHKGTIGDYYMPFTKVLNPFDEARQKKMINAVCQVAGSTFGKDSQEVIRKSLYKNFMVSTAEHHASITYSETLNILLNQFIVQEHHQLPLISLSCATVPLDNGLYPRGVFYKNKKIPFLSAKYNNNFVYKSSSINPSRFYDKIKSLVKEKEITAEEEKMLDEWFGRKYKELDLDKVLLLRDQISILNKKLWKELIDIDLSYSGCDYYMIPSEKVAELLFIEDSNSDEPSWIYQTLFEEKSCERLLNTLDGIRLCWDLKNKKGTFLFWGFTAGDKPVALFLKDNFLISSCESVRIQFSPDSIVQALKEERLVPASILFFLYAVFYAGLICFGGILQINYLREIQEQLISNNPLNLSEFDLAIIKETPTNRYVNFQELLPWTGSGLERFSVPMMRKDFDNYKSQDHFSQIQECLEYLYNI